MTLSLPPAATLAPKEKYGLFIFPSSSTDLVKLDLLFEAGSAYQHKKLCAAATARLMTVATRSMPSSTMAAFMDYRGILVEVDCQVQQSSLTFYFLRSYADELLPLVHDMLLNPSFNDDDFRVWCGRRRHELLAALQQPSVVARRQFYRCLFGSAHPLGASADASDLDALTVDDLRAFHAQRYTPANMTVVLAGSVDDSLVRLVSQSLGVEPRRSDPRGHIADAPVVAPMGATHIAIPEATQTALRIGRILPLAWDSDEYASFMLLTALLGGWFGSRLMQNLREDKGYTYGAYARSQIYRDTMVFTIVADVHGGMAAEATAEVMAELERLADEAVTSDELQTVSAVIVGDFLRSVDGIFERSARYCDMHATCVTERLSENLQHALLHTTPDRLRQLAACYLGPSSMIVCTAGV